MRNLSSRMGMLMIANKRKGMEFKLMTQKEAGLGTSAQRMEKDLKLLLVKMDREIFTIALKRRSNLLPNINHTQKKNHTSVPHKLQ